MKSVVEDALWELIDAIEENCTITSVPESTCSAIAERIRAFRRHNGNCSNIPASRADEAEQLVREFFHTQRLAASMRGDPDEWTDRSLMGRAASFLATGEPILPPPEA